MLKAVFFDLDDTILDYDLCAVDTVRSACGALGVPYSEEVQLEYRRVDDALWARQKLGELTIPQVLEIRDGHMMEYLGLSDGMSFQEAFIAAFAESAALVEGAEAALRAVTERGIPVYSASNGYLAVQTNRLQKAGVLQYFDRLFVSETIGHEKPDRRFFEHCLRETGLAAHEVLMVGDSVTADIQGALNAGWRVCFLNRHGKSCDLNCMEITSFADFDSILEGEIHK